MNKLCIGILFATAIAWAGIGVVNFPYGEKSGGPDACRAIQLNVQGVSPASGTVSIGEITAKWETETFDSWIVTNIFDGDVDSVVIVPWEKGKISYGDVFDWTYEGDEGFFGLIYTNGNWRIGDNLSIDMYDYPEDALKIVIVDEDNSYTGIFSRVSSAPIIVPHATTNALWTVTAAGGNATNNLPDKTFLRFAGHDFVRYGTATGGVVNLFVED